jgi:hypothetical protein
MIDKQWTHQTLAEDEISAIRKSTYRVETWKELGEFLSQPDDFWTRIEALADECDEILSRHGFPNAAEVVLHDGAGNWWRRTPDGPSRPPGDKAWRFTTGAALSQEHSAVFSDPWYAGRIGKLCRVALARAATPAEFALFLCHKVWAIATLQSDWTWRSGQKPAILTGRKQLKVLADHRGTANARRLNGVQARHQAIARMLRDTNLNGGALEQYLQRRLRGEADIAVSLRTIRRDLSILSGP